MAGIVYKQSGSIIVGPQTGAHVLRMSIAAVSAPTAGINANFTSAAVVLGDTASDVKLKKTDGYAVLYQVFLSKPKKINAYAVMSAPSTDAATVYKTDSYAVLDPGRPKVSKLDGYAVIDPLTALISKANAYAVLDLDYAYVSKTAAYVVLEPYRARPKKIDGYAVLEPNVVEVLKTAAYVVLVPGSHVSKSAAYVALEPIGKVKLKELSAYAAIGPIGYGVVYKQSATIVVGPAAGAYVFKQSVVGVTAPTAGINASFVSAAAILFPRNAGSVYKKSNAYAVLDNPPPISAYGLRAYAALSARISITDKKTSGYAVLQPAKSRVEKKTGYAVLYPRPTAVISLKTTGYGVMSPRPFRLSKTAAYAPLVPLTFTPSRVKSLSAYVILVSQRGSPEYIIPIIN